MVEVQSKRELLERQWPHDSFDPLVQVASERDVLKKKAMRPIQSSG